MNKNQRISLAAEFLCLMLALSAGAQSTYFKAITNFNPVGYWPMHEVAAPAPGDKSVGGMTLQWNGTNTGFQVYNYYNGSALLTEGHSGNSTLPNNTPLNRWYHVVVTCDANTNVNLYVNGVQGLYDSKNNGPFNDVPAVGLYTPDSWSPQIHA